MFSNDMHDAATADIRVFIIDDDAVYRQILARTFERIPKTRVVGSATSLGLAQRKLAALKENSSDRTDAGVDVVTIDVVLQEESGLTMLPWMAEHLPHVVTVLLTAGGNKAASLEVDALLLGASTLVLKPMGADGPAVLERSLKRLVDDVRHTSRQGARAPVLARAPDVVRGPQPREVVAVGASTGGPPIVLNFLRALPPSFMTPVVIVQHMLQIHTPFFIEQLARTSGRPVHMGAHGANLQPGAVYVAAGGSHLEIHRVNGILTLRLSDAPEENFCRPSVDVLMRSVARTCGAAAVGVVMSGMGSDGADGATDMARAGAPVIVQDEASSVVWGMPRAVLEARAAVDTIPGDQLAAAVVGLTSSWKKPVPGVR